MTLLQLKEVSYQVAGKEILHHVNLHLQKGGFLTLIGPSGSGKSTILKIVADLISPTKGTVYFKQQNVQQLDPIQYRRQVSYCFQQATLFGKTVRDNLTFPFIIRREKVDQDLIKRRLEEVDLGLDFLTKKITALSGGEKQRVALIRNLMFMPNILLLDEITTGLDERSKEIVHNLVRRIHAQGVTILQVTHDQSEITAAEGIVQLKEGRIIK